MPRVTWVDPASDEVRCEDISDTKLAELREKQVSVRAVEPSDDAPEPDAEVASTEAQDTDESLDRMEPPEPPAAA